MANEESRGTNTPSVIAENVSIIGIDDEVKTLPKIKKLNVSGNYYEWFQEIKPHFESLALWTYVDWLFDW